jgi:hypothetical protein
VDTGRFLSKSRTNVFPSSMQFPAIDVDGMIGRMRLKEKAKEQAEQGLPTAESQSFDAVEQEVVNEIENEAKIQYTNYLDNQKVYADRAGDVAIQSLAVRLGTSADDAVTDFQRHTHNGTGELYSRKREVIQTERELNRFKERHGLRRPARNYGKRLVKIGFLLIILVVESLLNGSFLAKGSVFGLVGGVFEALIIAGINVFVGLAVGRLVAPWIGHKNVVAQIFAATGVLVYLAAAVGFNLAVAHYRTAVAGDPFEASLLAYRSLMSDPLAIADLQSWALFIIGFIFSIAAAFDGWLMDDPYPGYGTRMRHNLEALENYNEFKNDLLNDLDEIKQRAEKEMDEIGRKVQDRQNEFGALVLRSHALLSEMTQHFGHLESAANTLLRFYRNENGKYRSAPVPARFDATWTYVRPPETAAATVMGNREQMEQTVRQVMLDIPQHRKRLHDGFLKALGEYKKIDELVDTEVER